MGALVWQFSNEARALQAGSHTTATRVDVLHAGVRVHTLEVVSGGVTAEVDRPVLRNLSCTLVDPSGALTRGDVDDLLNPYFCEIQPWRGVEITTFTPGPGAIQVGGLYPSSSLYPSTSLYPSAPTVISNTSVRNTTYELAPLGVFELTGRQVSDGPEGLRITLTGQDRAMGYQGPMSSSLAISGGTPVEQAVLRLLGTRNPGVNLLALSTGFTCGPLLYPPDIDVWREAQDLAASVGARLFHDRTGQARMTLAGPASSLPVAGYAEGDGLLLSIDRTEDSDTIRNVVVAESTNGAIRVVAEDSNPSSPTYAGGRYGRRVAPLVSQHFGSVAQAQQAATARLVYELGRSETVTFTAVPNPALDVEEVLSVHRPRLGLQQRGLVVASLAMPLGAKETMTVGLRKSVLAQDGTVLPPVEFAA